MKNPMSEIISQMNQCRDDVQDMTGVLLMIQRVVKSDGTNKYKMWHISQILDDAKIDRRYNYN